MQTVFSALLSILAAFSYGCGGVYAKKAFTGVSSLSLSIGQQLGAAFVLIPLTVFYIPTKPVSPVVVYSVLGLAVFCTAIAYLFYFYLLANVGPTKTLSVTFLVPVFGVIWGMIFLHEKITIGMIGGLMIILTSIFLLSDVKISLNYPHLPANDR
ncbi:DMT family transporter [Parageobacillus toebii]|nr:DMT family transporter [Parageobacillus toebii]